MRISSGLVLSKDLLFFVTIKLKSLLLHSCKVNHLKKMTRYPMTSPKVVSNCLNIPRRNTTTCIQKSNNHREPHAVEFKVTFKYCLHLKHLTCRQPYFKLNKNK